MVLFLFLCLTWSVFWVVGLAPRSARRPVDALAKAGWRGWHVLAAAVPAAWTLGLVTTVGVAPEAHGWVVGFAALPVVGLGGLLARRVEVTHLAGTHGSRVLPPLQHLWPEVDGDAAPASHLPAGRGLRTRFHVRTATPDLDVRDVRRSGITFWVGVAIAGSWVVGISAVLVKHLAEPDPPRGGIVWIVAGAAALFGVVVRTGHWRLNRRHARLARAHNGGPITWPLVAAAHGWRITRPGFVPYDHWQQLGVFHRFQHTPDGTTPLRPLVTLSGRVGDWEAWVVAGERGYPLVAAVRLPGLWLPRVELQRRPGTAHDTVVVTTQDEYLRELLLPGLWEHLGSSLPSFARLVLEGDLLALVTLDAIEPRPWRADAMVACALGVADQLPLDALLGAGRDAEPLG